VIMQMRFTASLWTHFHAAVDSRRKWTTTCINRQYSSVVCALYPFATSKYNLLFVVLVKLARTR